VVNAVMVKLHVIPYALAWKFVVVWVKSATVVTVEIVIVIVEDVIVVIAVIATNSSNSNNNFIVHGSVQFK